MLVLISILDLILDLGACVHDTRGNGPTMDEGLW